MLNFWRQLVAAKNALPERFLARRGQALIWAANQLHGGDQHLDPSRTRHSQVTHYYFEDCCYYTPIESYPMFGRILFKEPVDVSTGNSVRNFAAGKEVPPQFVRLTMPGTQQTAEVPPDFSAQRYLELNADVAAAGVDPWTRYAQHGFFEGRPYR